MRLSPIYVPACHVIANWYSLNEYSRKVGVFCEFAGCGGLIAQGPFSAQSYFVLLFVRRNPISLDDDAVNEETSVDTSTFNLKQKLKHLCNNFFNAIQNLCNFLKKFTMVYFSIFKPRFFFFLYIFD